MQIETNCELDKGEQFCFESACAKNHGKQTTLFNVLFYYFGEKKVMKKVWSKC